MKWPNSEETHRWVWCGNISNKDSKPKPRKGDALENASKSSETVVTPLLGLELLELL